MPKHPLAGKPVPPELLVNVPRLMSEYYAEHPDPAREAERVSFGTSGHRGTASEKSFTEDHILAIAQSIAEYRRSEGIDGPLFLGMDTHALSEAAFRTAIEVFAANGVELFIQAGLTYTPTPVISHAILEHNRRGKSRADGVVITPSHNPPLDGGFKYNPPSGGPAGTETTGTIQARANALLEAGLGDVKRMSLEKALLADSTHEYDYITPYVSGLGEVIDMECIRSCGVKIGVDPLGGSGIHFWDPISERYGLELQVVNRKIDPTFAFMTVDKDGKIRMDCSSPSAMASLIGLKDQFDIAFGNDPDFDRHGIVTPSVGLMNPNHYLAVAAWYLCQHRDWDARAAIGKTLVSSSMIDRVAASLGRPLYEVPVGFKWFVDGLLDGSCAFGGEESAGASFLRKDGSPWSTDKDGFIMDLLAAEITARTEQDPGEHYQALEKEFGVSSYERMDVAATLEEKSILKQLSPDRVEADELAGEKIIAKLTEAPGNGAAIGGLKVVTENGWFAARPSGTENIYKIYAESFLGEAHLRSIQDEAQGIVNQALHAVN